MKRCTKPAPGTAGLGLILDFTVELTARVGARLRMICVEEEIPRHAEVIDELREEKDRADSYFGQLAEHCQTRATMHSVDSRP